jgi:Lrp/AsnC family transcriptional regulator for asnA, asnC and gidA
LPTQPTADDTPQGRLDVLDRALLECLREDGRMPNSTIARRLGVGEATIRRRLQRLAETRGLRVVPVIDPDLIGLDTCIFVGLKVTLSQIEAVADQVRQMPEVRYLAYTTGPWDLLVEAFVGSRDHMASFLIGSLGKLEGVARAETFNVLKIAKFGYEWEIPDWDESHPGGGRLISIAHPTELE